MWRGEQGRYTWGNTDQDETANTTMFTTVNVSLSRRPQRSWVSPRTASGCGSGEASSLQRRGRTTECTCSWRGWTLSRTTFPLERKWASCSSNGRLTFNIDILGEPASFRREVIVHELLHLKVPNHGKVFKALLKAHLAEAG